MTWTSGSYLIIGKGYAAIMVVPDGPQKAAIMTAVQCSLNTVKTIGIELKNFSGVYEAVT